MIQQSALNAIAGWDFSVEDLNAALRLERMLNPSIDLSNPCNLNCPYCFIEEKNSVRKVRKPHELSLDETLRAIDDFCEAGATTLNLVGAGEPTIDPHFRAVVQHAYDQGLTIILFTNGIVLASNAELIDFLYQRRVSVVVKLNSFSSDVQDLVAGRSGYAAKRDRALELLIDRSFTSHMPTRLGIDTMVFRGNVAELPAIHEWARRQNVFPIAADYIPTGRTEGGTFQGHAALQTLDLNIQSRASDLLEAISSEERTKLVADLASIDARLGIPRAQDYAYYGGGICTQILGLYIDIEGNIWPCVARKVSYRGGASAIPLGNVRQGDLPSKIWKNNEYMRHIRAQFSGGCPYKSPLSSEGRDSSLITVVTS